MGARPPRGLEGAWVPGGDGAESETKATFKPKVSQTTRAARPHNSNRELTAGVYPVDFRTTKQTLRKSPFFEGLLESEGEEIFVAGFRLRIV